MNYKIYTFPNCEKCHKLLEFMKEKNFSYEEINVSFSNGKKEVRVLFKNYRDEIKRDDKGSTILPILTYIENNKLKIYQGEEGLAALLK